MHKRRNSHQTDGNIGAALQPAKCLISDRIEAKRCATKKSQQMIITDATFEQTVQPEGADAPIINNN